jgi:prophage tail gpP-like protein
MSNTSDFEVEPYIVSGTPYGRDNLAKYNAPDPFGGLLPSLPGKDPDAFTIIVDDLEIPVIAGKALRAADNAAAGWTATIAFNEDDDDLFNALLPYRYPEAACYLGGKLVCQGRLYTVAPSLKDERLCDLEGWSYTVDAVDSTHIDSSSNAMKNVTLEQRARHLVEPLGIKIIYDATDDVPFKRVAIKPTETIFSHLAKLAAQRGVLITSTEKGELKFINASDVWSTLGTSVGTLEEGTPPCVEFEAKFDGRKRFNTYKVINSTPGHKHKRHKKDKGKIAVDPMVPVSRQLTVEVHDVEGGEVRNAAEWRRSKQMAETLTINFPVSSWYAPNKKLWKENTIVTVRSATIFCPDGFDFLIRSVEYVFDDKGTRATLGLVPPQVFTGEPIDEPWATASLQKSNKIDRIVRGL